MKPSFEDKNITNRLIQVGKIVGLDVLDHIIITSKKKDYFSFADEGLMEELAMSTDYVPPYKLVEQSKKLAGQIAERKKAIQIAKAMKKNKIDVKMIVKITGVSVEEIGKLKSQ